MACLLSSWESVKSLNEKSDGDGGNTTIENYPRILCRFFLNINSRDKKKSFGS